LRALRRRRAVFFGKKHLRPTALAHHQDVSDCEREQTDGRKRVAAHPMSLGQVQSVQDFVVAFGGRLESSESVRRRFSQTRRRPQAELRHKRREEIPTQGGGVPEDTVDNTQRRRVHRTGLEHVTVVREQNEFHT